MRADITDLRSYVRPAITHCRSRAKPAPAPGKEGRSISEEVEDRIKRSFTGEVLKEIEGGLDEASRENSRLMDEQLQRPISRIQEELEADNAELRRARAINETTIEHAIDRALARAFAEMGRAK
jgi:hypothetical protein